MNLVINDIRVGDIYEHEMGGFYKVTEILPKDNKFFVGVELNKKRPKDRFHTVDQIRNFYGKYR